jgi:putative aldouronate transport system permease protein
MKKSLKGIEAFDIFNYLFLSIMALLCILPFIHVLSVSLSSSNAASGGSIGLLPVNFTLESYNFAFQKKRFLLSMLNSTNRVAIGVTVNMLLTIITAYPLSKTKQELRGRTVFSWFFVITMLISGGLIPTYMIVTMTGIRNTIWALVLPGAVPIFNVIILLNFFKQIPKELEESAFMDGAGQWRILARIYLPLSLPAIATLIVFQAIGHWNDWFSGAIYLDNITKYPLATYLHNVLVTPRFDNMQLDEIRRVMQISDRTLGAAQIMIGTIPILMVYPFLQRYFVKGMVVGSLK